AQGWPLVPPTRPLRRRGYRLQAAPREGGHPRQARRGVLLRSDGPLRQGGSPRRRGVAAPRRRHRHARILRVRHGDVLPRAWSSQVNCGSMLRIRLASTLVLCLAACGGGSSGSDAGPPDASTEPDSEVGPGTSTLLVEGTFTVQNPNNLSDGNTLMVFCDM